MFLENRQEFYKIPNAKHRKIGLNGFCYYVPGLTCEFYENLISRSNRINKRVIF